MEILLNERQIQATIKDLAIPVSIWKPDVILCTLSGAVPFFSDLIKHLDFDFETDFIKVKSYYNEIVSVQPSLQAGPFCDLRNKRVLIVEDIVDTGKTLNCIINNDLMWRGCSDVAIVSLLKRKSFINTLKYNNKPVTLAFGYEVEEGQWLVGYGLDDKGLKRNLKHIYVNI